MWQQTMKKLFSQKTTVLISAILVSLVFIEFCTPYSIITFVPVVVVLIGLMVVLDVLLRVARDRRFRRRCQQQRMDAIKDYYQYESRVDPSEMNT